MHRGRWTGLALLAAGCLTAAAFAFGWPPITTPAIVTGSDYMAVNSGSLFIVGIAALVALIGLGLVIDGPGGPPTL